MAAVRASSAGAPEMGFTSMMRSLRTAVAIGVSLTAMPGGLQQTNTGASTVPDGNALGAALGITAVMRMRIIEHFHL
ncbi:hypothetical protein BBJ66_18585 [Rhizobium sp. RSm-3]|nr:hypothetical protein BBJ66_18585 [Rhizobium sp. RSm-3]